MAPPGGGFLHVVSTQLGHRLNGKDAVLASFMEIRYPLDESQFDYVLSGCETSFQLRATVRQGDIFEEDFKGGKFRLVHKSVEDGELRFINVLEPVQ